MSCLLGFSKDGSYSYRTWSDNECINIYIWLYTYYLVYHKVSLKVGTQCGSSCLNICMDPWFVWSYLQGQDPKFPKQDTRPGMARAFRGDRKQQLSSSQGMPRLLWGYFLGISWVFVFDAFIECCAQNISRWVQISHEPSCSTLEWSLCEECTIPATWNCKSICKGRKTVTETLAWQSGYIVWRIEQGSGVWELVMELLTPISIKFPLTSSYYSSFFSDERTPPLTLTGGLHVWPPEFNVFFRKIRASV